MRTKSSAQPSAQPSASKFVRRSRTTRNNATISAAVRGALADLTELNDTTADNAAWRVDEVARRAIAACKAIRDARTRIDELNALAMACEVADASGE